MTTTTTADTKTQDQELSQSRIGRLRRRLFHNDPNDDLTLQPHIDEKLTKKSELWSFFLFGFGYYSWANSCASLLLPILIQGIARNASHLESDPSVPCPETDPVNDRCLVPFGWIHVTPTSYVLLTNVVTVWCTIVLTLGISALADHGRVSKRIMLFTSTLLCVIACFIFLGALEPSVWWLSTLLFVLSKSFAFGVFSHCSCALWMFTDRKAEQICHTPLTLKLYSHLPLPLFSIDTTFEQ